MHTILTLFAGCKKDNNITEIIKSYNSIRNNIYSIAPPVVSSV